MSHSQFLTLDSSKKPVVRKGVNYQSYVPPILPGSVPPGSRAADLRKVQVAMESKIGSTLDKVSRTLPEMGPFNKISPELVNEYFKLMMGVSRADSADDVKSGSYWDDLDDKNVKREPGEEGVSRSSSAFSFDSLRNLLSRLEAWNSRAIAATLGTGQVLCFEVDSLLEEAGLISVHVELPSEILTKLRILQRAGQSFAEQVRAKLTLKGKEKVPLKVLTDLMREAEALPIETEEVRFFRNQRGRIQSICHSAQKATKDKSLEKCKDVTVEAAEVRAILPDLDFLKEQVSIGEWVQKALAKVDKRGTVSLQTIEQLFDDPSAALIKPDECQVMADLKAAMDAARNWQTKTQKILNGIVEGRNGPRRMPSIEQLLVLQDEHANLPKICVPAMSSNIEGIVRRARAWIKKQERTLSGTWALGDAKNLLDEGRLVSHQVDLNPELGNLESEVAKAEDWCVNAKRLIASLALTEIDQIEPLVTASFKAPESVAESMEDDVLPSSNKRTRTMMDEPGYTGRLKLAGRELQGLKSYESALAELGKSLLTVQAYVVPLLQVGKLPTQDQLEALKTSLGIVRDPTLEDDITQLFEGAQKWSEKANSVLSVQFPRPAGVLRALSQIIHELVVCPMRYRDWDKIVQIAAEELWAHEVRFATFPIAEHRLAKLIASCPEHGEDAIGSPVRSEEELAAHIADQQEGWMREVLGLPTEVTENSPADILSLLRQTDAVYTKYKKECADLLTPRRTPMHTKAEAEHFLKRLVSSKLIDMQSLVDQVEAALALNDTFEAASRVLAERLLVGTEPNMFTDLLELLQSVETAELLVAHFDSFFTPMVGKLLQYQAKVRELFRWDADEQVQEPGYRPTLGATRDLWDRILLEAKEKFQLSEHFLTEVAYLASAYRALMDATEWRGVLEQSFESGVVISLLALKKHMTRGSQLPVAVPFEDILTNEAIAEMDEWTQQVNTLLTARARHKVRCSIEEADMLVNTASSLVVRSSEFELIESQLATARELHALATQAIADSRARREESDENDELARLVKECRKGPIAVGVEDLLETEIRTLSINRTLLRILARPNVVSAELVDSFLTAIREGPLDEEVTSFGASEALIEAAQSKLTLTTSWQARASPLVSLFPPEVVGKKGVVLSVTPPARLPLGALEQQLLAALNAPPTAAGEKNLDMMLRNLDRDLPGGIGIDSSVVREYAYPLPLYQVPADMPTDPNRPTPVEVQGKARARPTRPAALIENPLLRKGLNSLQSLLFQVPWTRATQGYLCPLNEVLNGKPAEWLAAEKAALKNRISQPCPVLVDGLSLLLDHKRGSLFQTSDFVKLRSAAASALRAVKACVTRFPFLQPLSQNVDVPTEIWERATESTGEAAAAENGGELDLVTHLLALDALALQVPTKYRLLLQMLDMYDWRVRAQSVCHYMPKEARPRPWAGDQRSLTWWNQAPGPQSVFAGQPVPSSIAGDPLCLHVAPTQPPVDFIICAMHMSFYYVVESIRHFIRVMSDMCELCFTVSTTESAPLWIACDACDKWFHGACVGLAKEPAQFTCPNCILANPATSPDRKRNAETLLRSLPARRFTPISQQVRVQEAENLLGEAQHLPVVIAMNLQEIAMFKRFLPNSSS